MPVWNNTMILLIDVGRPTLIVCGYLLGIGSCRASNEENKMSTSVYHPLLLDSGRNVISYLNTVG